MEEEEEEEVVVVVARGGAETLSREFFGAWARSPTPIFNISASSAHVTVGIVIFASELGNGSARLHLGHLHGGLAAVDVDRLAVEVDVKVAHLGRRCALMVVEADAAKPKRQMRMSMNDNKCVIWLSS